MGSKQEQTVAAEPKAIPGHKTAQHQTDVINASKTFISQGRTLATTLFEASWAPWLSMMEKNDMMSMGVRPWFDMAQKAHNQWLDMYENQSHQFIEQSYTSMQNTLKY